MAEEAKAVRAPSQVGLVFAIEGVCAGEMELQERKIEELQERKIEAVLRAWLSVSRA